MERPHPERRPDPETATRRHVEATYPTATAAFVGGSVVRGEGTATSDLDLVVVIDEGPAPYRETTSVDGWIVEAFVHTVESLRLWTRNEVSNRRPVLAQLVAEGWVVADRGRAVPLRAEMRALLETGPPPLGREALEDLRYGLSDRLDDLVDSPTGLQRLVIVAEVVELLMRLHREPAGRWSGRGKWMVRRLAEDDPGRLDDLEATALAAIDDPSDLIELADRWLAPHGGRLDVGYRRDGRPVLARLRAETSGDDGD